MFSASWIKWLSFLPFANKSCSVNNKQQTPCRTTLTVETLEDRWVPSAATLDLSAAGVTGAVNGAIFHQIDTQPTGTGVIDSFVRLQSNASVEQGFNTTARKLQFDENNSPQFTRALQLGDVPKINIGGVVYREFLLDINESNSGTDSQLSLDEMRFYVGSVGNLTGYDSCTHKLAGLSAVYDLDPTGSDNWLKLDAGLNPGSGKGDLMVYVPDSVFGGNANSFLYLYSKFGVNIGNNGGFEEWAHGESTLTATTSITVTVTGSTCPLTFYLNGNQVVPTINPDGTYTFDNIAVGLGDEFSLHTITVKSSCGATATQDITNSGGELTINLDNGPPPPPPIL